MAGAVGDDPYADAALQGLTTLEEFGEQTGFAIPEGPYDTVAGFVMAQLGRLPAVGDEVAAVISGTLPTGLGRVPEIAWTDDFANVEIADIFATVTVDGVPLAQTPYTAVFERSQPHDDLVMFDGNRLDRVARAALAIGGSG